MSSTRLYKIKIQKPNALLYKKQWKIQEWKKNSIYNSTKKWEQGKKDDGREILLTNNSVHQKW